VILACLALATASTIAQAASKRDWDECQDVNNAEAADRNIAACTRILNDPRESRNRSIAFSNRCGLWNTKKDPGRALADCGEAIRLDPRHMLAYNNRGNTYRAKGEIERAIADYSEAIRLNPRYAIAFRNRGLAYRAKGEHDRAIANYNEAIRIDPRSALAYNDRGLSHRAKGEHDRAIADYNEAIRIDPRSALAYNNRGLAYLYSGSLARAQADFKQASDLDPKDAYAALWLDLAERRNGLTSRLKDAVSQLDMSKWPAPVVRLYVGELTPEQTLAAADHADPKTRGEQVCEANFYPGALMALAKRKDDAVRLLRRAAADCPRTFLEWGAAREELKLLGAQP
jgi:lipoprotein NlpI